MSKRARAGLVGIACIACCVPLVLGVSTGLTGAIGAWFDRHEVVIISAVGLTTVVSVSMREMWTRQTTAKTSERVGDHH